MILMMRVSLTDNSMHRETHFWKIVERMVDRHVSGKGQLMISLPAPA